MVTHDRYVLDAVCSGMLEIDRGRIFAYPGNWSSFVQRRAERWANLEKADDRRKTILKVETAWLMRGARARATKSERRKETIREMQGAALERQESISSFSATTSRLGGKVVVVRGASKAWDGKTVLAPFELELGSGERLGIVGPNGSGKTTLLDLVEGRIEPDSGVIERGSTVRMAYFDQAARDIDRQTTVLGFIRARAELVRMADGSVLDAERLLERFLFPRGMHALRLEKLSGGELRRLLLVRLLAESPNVLLLDEPTNDLDVETIELLEDFLLDFPGTLVVVSHDRAFLDRVLDVVLALDGRGGLERFPGNYSSWRDEALRRKEAASAELAARSGKDARRDAGGSGGAASANERPPAGSGKRKPTWAERKEYAGILDEIAALEAEKETLEAGFASGERDPAGLALSARRHEEVLGLIEARSARWEALAEICE